MEYCTVEYCTVGYCTVGYCTVGYCTVEYCTVEYRTVEYIIVGIRWIYLVYIIVDTLLWNKYAETNATHFRCNRTISYLTP